MSKPPDVTSGTKSGGVSNDGSVTLAADKPMPGTAREGAPIGQVEQAPWVEQVAALWNAIDAIKKSVEASLGAPDLGPLHERVAKLETDAKIATRLRHPMGL